MTSFFKRFRLTHIIAGLCAGFILISTIAIVSSYLGYKDTSHISEIWTEFENGPSQKDDLYHELHSTLGFGGMIHQFKNYVIRHDAPRLAKIRDKISFASEILQKYSNLPLTDSEQDALKAIQDNILAYKAATDKAESLVASGKTTVEIDSVIRINDSAAISGLHILGETLGHGLDTSGEAISESVQSLHDEQSISAIIVLCLAGLLSTTAFLALRGIYQQLGTEPRILRSTAEAIAEGNLDFELDVDGPQPEGVYQSMIIMRENLRERIQKDQLEAQENGRIKQALENSSGSLMITDAAGTIVYMNSAVKKLLETVSSEIRKLQPSFSANNLVGTKLDQFYQQIGSSNASVGTISSTSITEISVCSLQLKVVMNPVWGEDNTRLGTVIEWMDRTQALATSEEIQRIVNAAKAGDLGQRIALEGKDGFFAKLSAGVNEMVDASDRMINDTATAVNAMSNGDLTRKIDAEYEGDFARLKNDVNTTIEKLTEVMDGITYSAHAVLSGSQEIATGNSNLSSRTEQQSSNLEETASSMEEMTSTVRQNAKNAREANKLASDARKHAEQGGNVVNKAVSAMSEITESSNKIAAIIGVIDEIAFQTNLLALNAAVEAARAGEQGRGFAVVASEVRNLAGRSATAANEIKGLIQDSVAKVEEGSKLVDESGQTLEEIVGSVKQVSEIIADIANASQEQSDGIDQVNRAISEIDEVTQQNTSLVEEAATASAAMGEQAANLNEMVGFFKTNSSSVLKQSSSPKPVARPAAKPMNTPVKDSKPIVGERRSKKRPWGSEPITQPNLKSNASQQTAIKPKPVSDSDWEEF